MKVRTLLFSFCSLCSLLLSTTWHVNWDGSGDYTEIQAGIDAAVDGDTILVQPGIYFYRLETDNKEYVRKMLLLK